MTTIKKLYNKELFTVHSSFGSVSLMPLTFPLLFESVMNTLQGTVNTAVLSGYSETAAAAVGAANSIISVALLIGTIISMGATVVISNSIGANDETKSKELSFASVAVIVLLALFITPVLLFSSNRLMTYMNLSGEVFTNALTYFRIRVVFLVFSSATSVLLSLLKCYGYPKYSFFIGLLTNSLNLILNIFVIYCFSPSDVVACVAIACCFSNVIGFFVTVYIFGKSGIKLKKAADFKQGCMHAANILKIGLPSGLSSVSFSLSQMITTSFVALLGDYALSAKIYYTNILSYVYLFSMSAGSANSLLVGRRYGSGEIESANKMNIQLSRITRIVNLLISLFVLFLHRPLVKLFTDNETIIMLSAGVFAIDIITEQARAVSQVYEYALRAAGDVLFSMIILIMSCWVCSIGLAYILAIKCHMGLIGCWIGLATDESIRGIVTYFRWKSGKWNKLCPSADKL